MARRSSTRQKRNNTHKFDNQLLPPLTPSLIPPLLISPYREEGGWRRREEIEDSEMSMRMLAMTPIVGNERGDSPIRYASVKSSNDKGM